MLHKVAMQSGCYAYFSTGLIPKTTKCSFIKFGMVVLHLKVLGVFDFGSYPSSKMPIFLDQFRPPYSPQRRI
jgi:hypothetical protein